MNGSIPCPFCGSEDYYITVTDSPFSYDTYSTAHCSKCHATGPFVAERYLEDEPKPARDFMETVAREKWETRPIEDTLNKRIADLVSSNMLMAKGVLDLKWQASEDAEERAHLEKLVPDLKKRIAVLEKALNIDTDLTIAGLRAELRDATARIAELEEKQRWIPVSERLPEFGTSILFYDSILERTNKGTCTALNRDKTNLQWLTDDGIYYHGNRCEYITHWKEEPARPEAQQ